MRWGALVFDEKNVVVVGTHNGMNCKLSLDLSIYKTKPGKLREEMRSVEESIKEYERTGEWAKIPSQSSGKESETKPPDGQT